MVGDLCTHVLFVLNWSGGVRVGMGLEVGVRLDVGVRVRLGIGR